MTDWEVRAPVPDDYIGFFDDSGSADTSTVVVAGLVSQVSEWTPFEQEWNGILSRPEFAIPFFHSVTFRSYEGPFAKFKDDSDLTLNLSKELIGLVDRRAVQSFGCVVDRETWECVNRDYKLVEEFECSFVFAATTVINKSRRWMEQHVPNEALATVFEQGTTGWGTLLEQSRKRWGREPDSGNAMNLPALQAADLVAWQLNRAYTDVSRAKFPTRGHKFWKSFDRLIADFGGEFWFTPTEEELRAFCRDDGVPARV